MSKNQFPELKDILLQASKETKGLSLIGIVGIASAAVIFGGAAWNALPTMLANLEPSILEEILPLFQVQLHS